jgi:Domain of unknown function (DUF5668)
MDAYVPNRSCYCARCRYRGYMGPVVLITLGVLFLLSEFTHWRFHQTWPILLIAIGLVKVLGSSAETGSHVPPPLPERLRGGFAPGTYQAPAPPPSPQNPQAPQGGPNV